MPSKQVTDRQKSADAVIAAVEAHAPSTAAALEGTLAPHLRKGEAMPDVALLLTLLARALGAEKQRLIAADEAHEAELGDDEPLRRARDEAAEELRQAHVDLREVLIGMYGGVFAAQILPGTTPRDPVVLARFSQTVENNLEGVKLPSSRIKGAKLDKTDTVGTLSALRQTLEQRLQAVAREVREAQATQATKDRAMDGFDGFFAASATVVSGVLRLVGMPELAARLRPSGRRPGQTAAQAGDVTESAGEEPAGG
jgi:hypothetical protein